MYNYGQERGNSRVSAHTNLVGPEADRLLFLLPPASCFFAETQHMFGRHTKHISPYYLNPGPGVASPLIFSCLRRFWNR